MAEAGKEEEREDEEDKEEKEEEKETKKKKRRKMKRTVLPQEKQTLPNEISTFARIITDFVTG